MKNLNQNLLKVFSKLYLMSEVMSILCALQLSKWPKTIMILIYLIKKISFTDAVYKQRKDRLILGIMNNIPENPTDQFIEEKSKEGIIQIINNLFILYLIISSEEQSQFFIYTFFLGQISSFGLCILLQHVQYENIKAMLINVVEYTLFSSLVIILQIHLIVFTQCYYIELIIIIGISLHFNKNKQLLIGAQLNQVAILFLIGYSHIKFRDSNLGLLQLMKQNNGSLQIYQYKMCQAIILELITVNYLIRDITSPLYQISLILFVFCIPTLIKMYNQQKDYIKYGEYNNITFENNNIQTYLTEDSEGLYTNSVQIGVKFMYHFKNLSKENEYLMLKKILENKRMQFQIKSIKTQNDNYSLKLLDYNQQIYLSIAISSIEYLDLILQSLVVSKYYLNNKISIFYQKKLDISVYNIFMKYYELTSVSENIEFQYSNTPTLPFKYTIYKSLILQNVAFKNLILPSLNINPFQVFVDLHDIY